MKRRKIKVDKSQIHEVVQDRMGYSRLRPGQQEALHAILDGHDTLAVMPTGWGKSAIYQVAAYLLPGPTIIVSPLIALQRDQLESIEDCDVGEAVAVNSTIKPSERESAMAGIVDGSIEFMFLAPEQLRNEDVVKRLKKAKPSLFVVDEAHCISEWGHDFRPDYMRLGAIVEALGRPTILALTATASATVRAEIVSRLGMRNERVIVQGFDRPNITLGVECFEDETEKMNALMRHVIAAEKPGIVYCATRRNAEDVATTIESAGLRAACYHAGLRKKDREDVQQRFMEDELDVIVATVAFGMGVDKPNVRFVFHHGISPSIDAYYQEVGRAGRDGEAAEAILFYREEDLNIHRFFASGNKLELEHIEQVSEALDRRDGPVDPEELLEEIDLSRSRLSTVVSRMEEVGAIETLPTGEIVATDDTGERAAERAVRLQELRREYDASRLEQMQGYALWNRCRREYILSYFGETIGGSCGNCDNCRSGATDMQATSEEEPFPVNSRVFRKGWGEGVVLRYEDGKIVVQFEQVGRKTLATSVVIKRGLLQSVAESE